MKIRPLLAAFIPGLLACQCVLAEETSAVYRDKVLSIPNGTVISDDGSVHYRNIRMVETEDGTFRVTAAQKGEIASVDEVSVHVDPATGIVQVTAEGAKSSACVDLLEPVVSRKDNEFTVVLAETPPKSDVCILILEFFEETFEIDGTELEPGHYTVEVNGAEAEFTL